MCPGYSGNYIGKKSCLLLRMKEVVTREIEPTFKHLSECKLSKESCSYYALASFYSDNNSIATIYQFIATIARAVDDGTYSRFCVTQ